MANSTKRGNTQFGVGDIISVHQKIKEGNREREVAFEGLVIAIRGRGISKNFIVRKIAADKIGVEKIFPLELTTITKIKVVKKGDRIRRAKLYYVRDKSNLKTHN